MKARHRRRRRRSALIRLLPLSLALHLAAVLVLLFLPAPPPRPPDVAQPGEVEIVMLPPAGVPEAPKVPVPEPPSSPASPSQPAPDVPPVAKAEPAPPPPAGPPPVAEPAPQPPPPPPAPRAEQAEPPAPTPLPPTPLRPTPVQPTPVQPSPRQASPATVRPPPIPPPIARSFADLRSAESGQSAAPAPPRRGLDLGIGPQARASNGASPRPSQSTGMVRFEGVNLGEDWARLLHQWWEAHGYYPRQAAELGEDGTTGLRLVLDRSGQVRSVELELRSGSQFLDLGSLAIFRGAHLPPFPMAVTENQATVHLTIEYILRGRRG